MTLREVLKEMQSYVNDDRTEDQILDMEIELRVSASTGSFTSTVVPKEVKLVKHHDVAVKKDNTERIQFLTSFM